jgi:putative addiction module component (TIGR02574 family)
MNDLRSQIEGLSATEKAELLDAVWQSLEADATQLTNEQRSELDRRIERSAENPDHVIPWEQVRADLLKKP